MTLCRKPGRLRRALLTSAVLLCLLTPVMAGEPGSVAPSSAPSPTGSVLLEFAGTVEIARGGVPPWQAAVRGQAIVPGDQLRTGADSRATVRLSDRSVIRVNQRTTVELQPPASAVGRHRFRLREGGLFFLNRERPADVEFETPIASGAIRGTEFLLTAEAGTGATRVAMVDGRVELRFGGHALELGAGEEAVLEPGQAPRISATLPITGLVQWSFYYPGALNPDDLEFTAGEAARLADSFAAYRAGDLGRALAAAPADLAGGSAGAKAYLAALKLAFGQVAEAQALLAGLPGDSPAAGALRGVIAAVTGQDWTPPRAPATSTELLADSYFRQSRSDLEGARVQAVRATELAPAFGFAWARLAELEFGFGRRAASLRALAEARRLSPRNAQAVALDGFLELEANRPRRALGAFDAAIALDGALGNAWLGRALAEARLGNAEAARRDLQTAASLEPQRALFRSYLGKGWAQTGEDGLAAKDFALAQRLDPADPTAWLYSGLHRHQTHQLNDAVRDLERSVALNDNRSVFRSRLLLDQDRAVRSADLAAVYQSVSLDEVAERAAARAMAADSAGFSGHLFLARSLQAREDPARFDLRFETARQSELLVANLLAPAGGGNLSQLLSQSDQLQYFDPPPVAVNSLTEYRSSGDWQELGTVFGQAAGLSYALDGHYQSRTGTAPNTDFERHGYSLQARQQVTPGDSVYVQAGYREDSGGDVAQHYDPASATAGLRFHEIQEGYLYAGYHRAWSPGNHTLLLAARLPDRLALTNPAPDVLFLRQSGGELTGVQTDPFAQLDFHSDYVLQSVELQQVVESPRHAFILGGRYQSGSVDNDALLTRGISGTVTDQSIDEGLERLTAYAYTHWRPFESLQFTAGLTYDDLEFPRNADLAPLTPGEESRSQLSPKLGLTWETWEGGQFRATWGQALGGLYFDDSVRLEPTQVAGFVNAFRSLSPESVVGLVAGTSYETWGLGFDQRLRRGTYFGVTAERLLSDGERTVGALTNSGPLPVPDSATSTRQTLAFEERALSLYAHQLLGRDWVAGARYRVSEAELEGRFPDLPVDLPGRSAIEQDESSVLQQVQLVLGFNHPTGWFAQWASNWYHQNNRGYTPDRPGDDFWQHDLAVGYRFARRRAEVRVGVLNLTDTDYRLNPLNLHADLARERMLVTSLRLNL